MSTETSAASNAATITATICDAYDFHGQTIFVTGGFGVLGGAMVAALAAHGANVAVLSRRPGAAARVVAALWRALRSRAASGASRATCSTPTHWPPPLRPLVDRFGAIDGLINAAGGNRPEAISNHAANPARSFFDLPPDAMRWVFDLNLMGTILPSQIVGRHMAAARPWGDPQHHLDGRHPAADARRRLCRCQGCRQQLYPVAGRIHGAGVWRGDPRQRPGARLLSGRAES